MDIKGIINLLSLFNVKEVIYVDDIFEIENYRAEVSARVSSFIDSGQLDKLPKQLCEPKKTIDKAVAKELFDSWWDDKASIDDKKDYAFNELSIDKNLKSDNILICLNELEQNDIRVSYIEPDDFNETYIDHLKSSVNSDNHVLLLMDQELNSDRHGNELLELVADIDYLHCGLFSEKFRKSEEIKKWKEFGYSPQMMPLAKERLDDESSQNILEGFRDVLWLCQISKIKKFEQELVEKAHENAYERFSQMDPASFDLAVMKNSKEEGCWELVTMNRILMLMIDTELNKNLIINSSFENIQNDLSKLRQICEVAESTITDNEWLMSLRNDELFIDGNIINKTYSPVENGDVFMINEIEYILLCQPCNLMIRKEGKRNYSLNHAYLLKLEKETDVNKLKDNDVYIEYIGEPKRFVAFRKSFECCLTVMDLVSFNDEGKAFVNINHLEAPAKGADLMQPNLLKRYKEIVGELKRYKDVIDRCSDDDNAKKALNNIIKSQFRWKPKIESNGIVSFNIKRVKRYNEYLSHILLQQLMNHLSRPATKNDFSKMQENKVDETNN